MIETFSGAQLATTTSSSSGSMKATHEAATTQSGHLEEKCWPNRQVSNKFSAKAVELGSRSSKTQSKQRTRMAHNERPARQTATTVRHQREKPKRSSKMMRFLAAKQVALLLFMGIVLETSSSDTGGPPRAAQAQISLTGGLLFGHHQAQAPIASSSSPLLNLSKRDLTQLEPSPASVSNTKAVCQVNGGESVAIVEIEESRGSDMSQSTNPAELPIAGSVSRGEIELKIESETHKYFQIQDKRLRLVRPLDRDAVLRQNTTQLQIQQQPITSIYLQISCVDKRPIYQERESSFAQHSNKYGHNKQAKKVIIPVLVRVHDINDNAPKFSQPVYTVQVDELAPVGTIVADQIQVIDLDSANNGLVEYSLIDSSGASMQPTTNRLVQRAQPPATPPVTGASQNPTGHQASSSVAPTTLAAPLQTTTSSTTTTTSSPKPSDLPPISSAAPDDSITTTTTTASAPSSAAAPQLTRSSQGPTINLNSEPIVNGPMEEADDEESDEALLASMNSTDVEETNSDSMMLMMPARGAKRRRRRRRRDSSASSLDGSFGLRRFVPWAEDAALPVAGASQEANANKPKLDLWTDLMSMGDDPQAQQPRLSSQQQRPTAESNSEPVAGSQLAQSTSPPADPDHLAAVGGQQRGGSLEYFTLELNPQTNRPIIRLRRQLDYETRRTHQLTLVATDRAPHKHQRLTSSATILVKVLDGDDQGPAFMLEQGGCATGSVPSTSPHSTTTPVSSLAGELEPSLVRLAGAGPAGVLQRRQLDYSEDADESPRPSHQREHHNLPKGFKVTDENFDFSDANSAHSGLDEEGEQDDQPTGSIVRLDPSAPFPSTTRSRRFPPAAGGAQAADSTPAPRPSKPSAAAAGVPYHHHRLHQSADYTCLSGWALNSGQAEYFATVMSGESDYLLRVAPQAIKARDRDELNAPIRYSFVNGTPTNYSLYFQINPLDATIKQVAPIERSAIGARVVLWVQAQEQTANALASVAKLTIDVVPSDKNPAVLVPNSYVGFVDENSPIGSSVSIGDGDAPRASGVPLQITVVDADYSGASPTEGDQQQTRSVSTTSAAAAAPGRAAARSHLYEFETTSDAFKVNKDGIVYVNKWPLDRDAPGQAVHMFQVTGRQVGLASSRSISSPISINITLLDLNDNPPTIANSSLVPIQLPASTNRANLARLITTIRAEDSDEPQNARVRFSIHHVSNGGRPRFRLNEESGQLEALGKFQTGEQFSLTLQAQDELGRTSQAILEVNVVPGPNSGGPQFLATPEASDETEGGGLPAGRSPPLTAGGLPLARGSSYSVVVNEGVAPNSAIFQLQASDPENDPIVYSIVEGNINNDFYVNSKTGTIFVANKLDREEVSAYTLLVQARDSGGLATTRALHVSVSDNNDQNPVFSAPQYTFSVEEGLSSKVLGRVWASDGDAGDNGRVSYRLEPAPGDLGAPFAIDQQSGEVKLTGALDYERAKSHTLLVTARDHGEEPRSATVSVLVRVLDVQDEVPYFERANWEVRLQENLDAGHRVTQVLARDPDSAPQITYMLKMGDPTLFAVDAQSGLVTTKKPLDFEEAKRHVIIVGTSEAQQTPEELAESAAQLEKVAGSVSDSSTFRSPICRIEVLVTDTNDYAPQFLGPPLPVRVQDTTQLGSQVARLNASDLDGSEPNNQVRYELVVAANSGGEDQKSPVAEQYTSERCARSFMVDATTGVVSIRSDLRRDSQSECQLVVRAKDLGQQPRSLSSTVQLIVYIDHIAEISSATMIGFADTLFTIEMEENSPPNTLVKVLPIVNKPKVTFPMSCEIISGNELAKFYVMDNEQRDCELRTRDPNLDYEQRQRYTLTVRLNTIGSGSPKTLAQVQVNLVDKNDNRPVFQQPTRYSHLTQNRFLAAIASDAPSETQVLQLRASDADSPHSNGLISYELLNENELEGRFKVDPIDGIVRTSRSVEDVTSSQLPLKIKVMARDNPEQPGSSQDSVAELVVNIVDDRHRIALALENSPTGRVLESKEELLSALQERSGLISGLEKAESLKIQRNGSLEPDVSGTDFWFYLIEPGTLRIVSSDDARIKNALFEPRSQSSLLDVISQIGFPKARLRLPYTVSSSSGRQPIESPSRSFNFNGASASNSLSSALILIGLFIAVTSAIVIVYQCGFWSSYSRASKQEKLFLQQQQQQQQTYYQCNSFLGVCPKGPGSLTGSPQESYPFRSGFSTLAQPVPASLLDGCQVMKPGKQQPGLIEPIYQIEPPVAQVQQGGPLNGTMAANSKEYETQMLKMSVLFDDCNSLNEQNNLHENNISKNLNI